MRTTVWLVEDAGLVYIRTDPRSGKVKRIRRDPHIRIATANSRGEATGEWMEGEARFVEGQESDRILRLFRDKYGLQLVLIGWMARVRGIPPMQVISIALERGAPV